MKRWNAAVVMLICAIALPYLAQKQPVEEVLQPVLGIVITAAEDDRRDAQYEALVHDANANGFKVLEMPVERSQEAQIEAVRALIVYQVDAIVFTPVVESGWDNVLRESKTASIPLITVERSIRCADDMLVRHIGFDYELLATEAAEALLQKKMPQKRVLELYGTVNSSDAREIARGCRQALKKNGLDVTYSLCGDGMRSRGYEILQELDSHLGEIGYIFAQNDAMALGAVDYLLQSDRKPGKDVLICAFGGGAELRALQEKGEVAVIGAVDDVQLAALTVRAAHEMIQLPQKSGTMFADSCVLTEGGQEDA